MSCGTCKHYIEVDARKEMMDPQACWMVCGWKPTQPFWMEPPYLSKSSGIFLAVRKPGDGEACPTYAPQA